MYIYIFIYLIYIFYKSRTSLYMLQQNLYNENNRYLKWIGRSICVKFKPKYYEKLKKLLPEIRKEYKVKGFSRVQMCGSDVDDEILLIFYKD